MNQPQTWKLPHTLALINGVLGARHAAGLSVEVIDVKALRDARGGEFRFQFVLDDGDVFHVDSLEMSNVMRDLTRAEMVDVLRERTRID